MLCDKIADKYGKKNDFPDTTLLPICAGLPHVQWVTHWLWIVTNNTRQRWSQVLACCKEESDPCSQKMAAIGTAV